MSNYDIIMKSEKDGIGHKLDSRMRNQLIPAYFNDKYEMSYHSTAALLYIGEYPGIVRKMSIEITEEVQLIPGCKVSKEYFPAVTFPNIKMNYPKLTWLKIAHKIRPGKFKPSFNGGRPSKRGVVKMHEGICMYCSKAFEVNALEHPANLCVCLKCCPNGIYHNKRNEFKKYIAPFKH